MLSCDFNLLVVSYCTRMLELHYSKSAFFQVGMRVSLKNCVLLTLPGFVWKFLLLLVFSSSPFPLSPWAVDTVDAPLDFLCQLVHTPRRCFEFFPEDCSLLIGAACQGGYKATVPSTLLSVQWSTVLWVQMPGHMSSRCSKSVVWSMFQSLVPQLHFTWDHVLPWFFPPHCPT